MPNIHDFLKQQALKQAEKEKQQAEKEKQQTGKVKKKFKKFRPYTIVPPESQGFKKNFFNYEHINNATEKNPTLEIKNEITENLNKISEENLSQRPILQKEILITGLNQTVQKNKNADPNETLKKEQKTITRQEQDASLNFYEAVKDKLSSGYTKFPNDVLKRIALGELTQMEIRVYSAMLRFSVGFSEQEAEVSKEAICQYFGVDKGNYSSIINNAYKSLQEKKLIEKLPPRIKGSSSVFRIVLSNEQSNIIFSSPKKEIEKGGVQFTVDEIKNKIIADYFSGLTEKKKAKEIEDYKDLKNLYSEEELSRALNIILTDSKYKEVYSPFAYLCHSIDSILQAPLKSDASVSQEFLAKQEQDRLLREKTEEEKRQNLQGLFEKLPDDEKEKYLAFARRKFNLTKGGSLEKKMAINEWSKNQPIFQEAQA